MNQGKYLVEILKKEKHYRGAEIGVFEGDTTLRLLEGLPNLRELYCVDPWAGGKEYLRSLPFQRGKIAKANYEDVYKKFRQRVKPYLPHCVRILRTYSDLASAYMDDGSLDFVFIDANHLYEWVKTDIQVWTPKVRKGGIISGHDYINKPKYGVIKAVHECFVMQELHVNLRHKVWWTRKK